ncbi:lysosome-associated membrane glycoprotein 3 isoform X2 [Odocoileus virginianus]|uniref:Lysosome-associated membrane glycoprotein 3 n=1 Tax=Odocoileus virginianus TaxID=9874 RepID=A0A6J0WHX0_ODOVR|nr:lysosome-associated membrane glycoprotein 3 isoform X2 [Odocoileus virginianus texanus]
MSWQIPAVVVLFVSLAAIWYYDSHRKAKVFPEITGYSLPTTEQATVKPSLLQPTNHMPHKTAAARSTDGHVTSQTVAKTSNSETLTTNTTIEVLATTFPVTTKSTLPTSPTTHTLVTTLATPNKSHVTFPVTEAKVGLSVGPSSPPATVNSTAHTTGNRPSTASHTTGKTTRNQTTLPVTLSTLPHNITTSQKPTQPTHTPGPTTAAHNTTQTASPATIAPRPTLAPQPLSPKTGIYQVLNGSKLCIKAEMGIQLTVQDSVSVFSPQKYFNIDPNATQASGNCGSRKSNLLLTFQGGFVNLTFTKDENSYYISEVEAYLTVSNPEKVYQGMKRAMMMFETVVGHSFKCVSEQSLQLSTHLQLKTMNVQLQAFDFEDDHFGNVDECSSDYTVVLPVIAAIVVGLLAVGCIVYAIRLRHEYSGYQRI